MRNLVIFLHMSLDGIVEGPNGAMDIGFVAYDQELENFAQTHLASVDTILWGRATYQMMYAYWTEMLTNPEATAYEKNHAKWISNVDKHIASKTLKTADWKHSTLIKENLVETVKDLKNTEGQDILVLGSPRLAKYLLQEQLVDKIKITVSPTLVGNGLGLFDGITAELDLISSEQFDSGALGLVYNVLKL